MLQFLGTPHSLVGANAPQAQRTSSHPPASNHYSFITCDSASGKHTSPGRQGFRWRKVLSLLWLDLVQGIPDRRVKLAAQLKA